MKKEEIQILFSRFEQVSCILNDVECWSARDLCSLLGYTEWRNFTKVIEKAKNACSNVGHNVADHFVDVNKMVPKNPDLCLKVGKCFISCLPPHSCNILHL